MKRLFPAALAAAALLLVATAAPAQLYVNNGGNAGIGDWEGLSVPQPLTLKTETPPASFWFQTVTPATTWAFKIASTGKFSIARIGSGNPAELILASAGVNGKVLDINGRIEATSFDVASSKALKEGFEALTPSEVLAKVAELPISRWHYKADPTAGKHIGPMAEDFHAAFEIGADDSISVNDATGVALAAIQGLHQEARQKDELIADLMSRIEQLEARLAER